VRQLEQELSIQLFDRFGSRITLTTAGKIFSRFAEQILELRRQAQNSINELEQTPRGELVIAANEATCIYILPQVFAEYARRFPNVQLLVERAYASKIPEALLDNLVDFGFTQLPLHDRKLQVVKIYSDEIKLTVPAGHPLCFKKQVTAEDAAAYPLLLPKYGTTRARINEWLELFEDSMRVAMELDSSEIMKRFVMAGLGLAFLTESNCQEEIASGRMHALSLAPEPMIRTLGLVYRKDKPLSKAALGFIAVVLEHAGRALLAEEARA
jgi:DNA-binding transcriptional LysR family regulator